MMLKASWVDSVVYSRSGLSVTIVTPASRIAKNSPNALRTCWRVSRSRCSTIRHDSLGITPFLQRSRNSANAPVSALSPFHAETPKSDSESEVSS